jgi:prolipoprotein diacylglyceryltransferase
VKENFYRTGQVGKQLGISSYRVRQLCASGLIPDAELTEGGQWMVPGSAVEKLSLPLLGVLRLSPAAFWGAATIAMLAGMVLARMGCLIAGCCAGRPSTSWFALDLPGPKGVRCRRLPSQLLEAGLALSLLLASKVLWRRLPFDGALFLGALAFYSFGRWWLELTKETIDRIGTISIHRALSAISFVVSIAAFVLIWRHSL